MIKLTRLNNTEIWLSPHQIEFMEKTPDTVISLVSGRKIIVRESIETIIEKIVDYRRKISYIIKDD
jgi:flagellar protein FlbD